MTRTTCAERPEGSTAPALRHRPATPHPVLRLLPQAGNRAVAGAVQRLSVQRDGKVTHVLDAQNIRIEEVHNQYTRQALEGMGLTLTSATPEQRERAQAQADALTRAQCGDTAFAGWQRWGAGVNGAVEAQAAQELEDQEIEEWAAAHPVTLPTPGRPHVAPSTNPAATGTDNAFHTTNGVYAGGNAGVTDGTFTGSIGGEIGAGTQQRADGTSRTILGGNVHLANGKADPGGPTTGEVDGPSATLEAEVTTTKDGWEASATGGVNYVGVKESFGTPDDNISLGVGAGFGAAARLGFRTNADGNMTLHIGGDVAWFTGDLTLTPADAEAFAIKVFERSTTHQPLVNSHDPTSKL